MTLGEKQRLFVRLVGELIDYAYVSGYELSFGDAYRDPRLAAFNAAQGSGITNSLHCERLAVDFNLFKDGTWLTSTDAHLPLGNYWKTLHPLCCWGGDFIKRKDGNHYGITHNGIK